MIAACTQCNRRYKLKRKPTENVICPVCQGVLTYPGGSLHIKQNRETPQQITGSGQPFGDELKQILVQNLKTLYPMPHVILKARKLLNDPESDFTAIGNLLKTDPALAGRVLKVANSAYYGMSGQVSSIRQATVLLGTRLLNQILTMVSHSKMLGKELNGYGLSSGELWRHSLAVAVAADMLSAKLRIHTEHDLFFAGLIHDSGKILLNRYLEDRLGESAAGSQAVSVEKERELLGVDHAEAGYELCRKWNLPEQLSLAVKYHHCPEQSDGNDMAYLLNLSNHMFGSGQGDAEARAGNVRQDVLAWLGLNVDDVNRIVQDISFAVETLEEESF